MSNAVFFFFDALKVAPWINITLPDHTRQVRIWRAATFVSPSASCLSLETHLHIVPEVTLLRHRHLVAGSCVCGFFATEFFRAVSTRALLASVMPPWKSPVCRADCSESNFAGTECDILPISEVVCSSGERSSARRALPTRGALSWIFFRNCRQTNGERVGPSQH